MKACRESTELEGMPKVGPFLVVKVQERVRERSPVLLFLKKRHNCNLLLWLRRTLESLTNSDSRQCEKVNLPFCISWARLLVSGLCSVLRIMVWLRCWVTDADMLMGVEGGQMEGNEGSLYEQGRSSKRKVPTLLNSQTSILKTFYLIFEMSWFVHTCVLTASK